MIENWEMETESEPESDYDEVDEELKFGTEEDIADLKQRGKSGDYIIYHKEDDPTHPMRIAFLKTGGKSVVQKLKVKKSSEGFAFQSSNPTWYHSMSDLALNTTDENSKRLIHPFLGYVATDVCTGLTAEDESEYATIDQVHIALPPPPPPPPIKP